mmetsp:Transcript_1004/g.1943  ORF Transcript_1004/g.1943 Transcript_1004/m.1943 type:complete len:209 (+) Transcript_1004:796-1422(+)
MVSTVMKRTDTICLKPAVQRGGAGLVEPKNDNRRPIAMGPLGVIAFQSERLAPAMPHVLRYGHNEGPIVPIAHLGRCSERRISSHVRPPTLRPRVRPPPRGFGWPAMRRAMQSRSASASERGFRMSEVIVTLPRAPAPEVPPAMPTLPAMPSTSAASSAQSRSAVAREGGCAGPQDASARNKSGMNQSFGKCRRRIIAALRVVSECTA